MEHVLRNTLLTLLEQPDATLADILRILNDKSFRAAAVARIRNEQVRQFWITEYDHYPPRLKAEAIAPIQNKVGAFLADPTLRRILTSPEKPLQLRRIMDEGKILIVNLARGQVGEDTASLLGALLVTTVVLAAFSRSEVQATERRPFFVYLDEFQSFTTRSLATMTGGVTATTTYTYAGSSGSNYADPDASTQVGNAALSYDKNGNLTTGQGGLSLAWDWRNRLSISTSSVQTINYAYDENDKRVRVVTATTYYRYPNDLYSYDFTSNLPVKHVFANGHEIATVNGATGSGVSTTTSPTTSAASTLSPIRATEYRRSPTTRHSVLWVIMTNWEGMPNFGSTLVSPLTQTPVSRILMRGTIMQPRGSF
jgi:hypothetical protein